MSVSILESIEDLFISVQDITLLSSHHYHHNPLAIIKAENITKANYIIATHNHFDHVNDIPIIAKNTNATVISIFETANELASKGCEKTIGCNIGGRVKLNNIELIFTQAFHSMSSNPSGVVIFFNKRTIFHAGDTGVFGDMKLIGIIHAAVKTFHHITISIDYHNLMKFIRKNIGIRIR